MLLSIGLGQEELRVLEHSSAISEMRILELCGFADSLKIPKKIKSYFLSSVTFNLRCSGPILYLRTRPLRRAFAFHKLVESSIDLLHNCAAFTSPVGEVVAWGEDTWP